MPSSSKARSDSARGWYTPKRAVACAALLVSVPIISLGGAALANGVTPEPASTSTTAADQPFTQKVSVEGGRTTWSFSLKDGTALDYADVNVTPKGQTNPHGFRMEGSGDGRTWTFSTDAATTTDAFTYYFVYKVQGSGVNAPTTATFDQSGKPTTPGTPGTPVTGDTFPLHIVAKDSDKADYVTIVGQNTPGHYAYVGADGTVKPVSDQPNGMSFPLASLPNGTVTLPSELQGGRIFISKKPMVMPAATGSDGKPNDSGYAGPNRDNPADPNQGNTFDVFEYTFKSSGGDRPAVHFGGNTTQVDGFSIPMTAELKQDSSGFAEKVGIEGKSASQVVADYKKFVGNDPAFTSLVNADGTHITAPRSSNAFTGAGATYFDASVNGAWAKWKNGFKLVDGHRTFEGKTEGDKLTFREMVEGKQVGEVGSVTKPTTGDVAACAGNLAAGTDADKFVEAHLCAAFNRGIAENDTSTWGDPATYFKAGTTYNKYVDFLHKESIDGRAYGFAYDDVHNQSTVMILPNADVPTSLTLTIGG
ncbi:beta-1,3-glucanase family protein [Streptomyces erythrochromogenes]|uniref:beta-1,3-glucanase family protein n=1 Tax=Streptomyces erythrochromogenes TaxID=285574 RepID=UPI0034464410